MHTTDTGLSRMLLWWVWKVGVNAIDAVFYPKAAKPVSAADKASKKVKTMFEGESSQLPVAYCSLHTDSRLIEIMQRQKHCLMQKSSIDLHKQQHLQLSLAGLLCPCDVTYENGVQLIHHCPCQKL